MIHFSAFVSNDVTGAFVGVSIEGHIFATRKEANVKFYGDTSISGSKILSGSIPRPRAAAPLYSSLEALFGKYEESYNRPYR